MVSRRRFLNSLTIATLSAAIGRLARSGETGSGPRESENLVILLRDTPRESLLEVLIQRIRNGLDYRQLLGAVAEVAAREVSPYPIVGFKYHAFMVMHAVHLSTVNGQTEDRWLPVLWASDLFKASQARDTQQTDWTMWPTPRVSKTNATLAEAAFVTAMEQWHPEAADVAVVALACATSTDRMFEQLFRYAARDFRHIGHKAITAANCHRLIKTLGSSQAIPMLQSLTYALQNYGDGANPALADLVPDRPWRRNLELASQLPKDWLKRTSKIDAVVELLVVMRTGTDADAAHTVVAMIQRGAGPSQIWSALFAAAGELLLRQSGIIAVHANATCNALHYAY